MLKYYLFSLLLSTRIVSSLGQNSEIQINTHDLSSTLGLFFSPEEASSDQEVLLSRIEKHIQSLKEKYAHKYPPKSLKLARKIFFSTHKNFLKRYHKYVDFLDLAARGEYDCVSASALMALIYQKMGYEMKIKETPFHVYLLLYLKDGKRVLIESTNPMEGFIDNQNEISHLELAFTRPPDLSPEDRPFNYSINLVELAGLQYYNQAVKAFNAQSFEKATLYLQKAHQFYAAERIKALKDLSMQMAANQ